MHYNFRIKLSILACIFTVVFMVEKAISKDFSLMEELAHVPDVVEIEHCEGPDCIRRFTS